MQAANQARDTAASVADALTDLQFLLVGLYANDPAQMTLNIGELAEQLSTIAHAAEQGGARALPNVTLRLVERLLPMQQQTIPVLEVAGALEEWVQLALGYLEAPTSDTSQALIDFLNLPLWNEALSQGQIAILGRLFEIDSRPAPPAAHPIEPMAAALDDREVAKLLDVTARVPAASEATVNTIAIEDCEATMLAEMPRELLAQMAAAAAAADAVSGEITSTEPTVQIAALVLDAAALRNVAFQEVAHETVVLGDTVHEDVVLEDGVADVAVHDAVLYDTIFKDTVLKDTVVCDTVVSETEALTSTPDFELPHLPAVADPSTGWDDAVPGPSIDEPGPIPSLPGQYEGEPQAAVWTQHAAHESAATALIEIVGDAATQDWDQDLLADYDGEVPLPIADEAPLFDAELPLDTLLEGTALEMDGSDIIGSDIIDAEISDSQISDSALIESESFLESGPAIDVDAQSSPDAALWSPAHEAEATLEPSFAASQDLAPAYPG
jgi:hypothetical protein